MEKIIKTKKIINPFLLSILIIVGLFLLKSDSAIGEYADIVDREIQELNEQIQAQRKQLDSNLKKQEEYNRLISQKNKEKSSLENQLEVLDNHLKKAELEIEEATLEISKNNLEIKKVEIDIDNKNTRIEKEKDHISNLLKFIYKQNKASPLEVILLNNSLTDFINQITYLENTNKEISDSLGHLKEVKENLEEQENILSEKQKKLVALQEELKNKQEILSGELHYKEFILEETKKSEQEFQRLQQIAKKENDQAMAEIASLEKTVRKKLAEREDSGLAEKITGFIWPVPKNVITATFHDPSYPFRSTIGEHPAIDIRAAQGTTLRSAAAGYVARVKFDGSTAYAYIMIIHADNYSTVYGHVSGVSVTEDEYVGAGQIIGRTGGAPRTAGAGAFSTGPHLHFEIRKNGLPVDPLLYLP